MRVTAKKAWKAMVASRMIRRRGYGVGRTPGSVPMSEKTNTYPLSRKCTNIASCP